MSSCCSTPKAEKPNFFQNKVLMLAAFIAAVVGVSYIWPVLVPLRLGIFGYAQMIFWPLTVGLVIGGVIDYYVPREYVSIVLAGKKKRNILYAVLWGFLMTVCSHGILAIAIQLYKKGASPSAVVAFLLASPWANFPLTLMLIGFFGPAKAAFILLSAVVIALITGWTFQVLERKGWIEANPNTVEMDIDFRQDIRRRLSEYKFDLVRDLKGIAKGVRELAGMVMWWMMLGTLFAAAAGAYIPSQFFHRFLGRSFSGLLVTLVIATVIETCSIGSSPLAFEIYRQTGAFGNALVFLIAGVATNYTAIGLLWVNAGRRTALWMPVICIPLILLIGFIGNQIFH